MTEELKSDPVANPVTSTNAPTPDDGAAARKAEYEADEAQDAAREQAARSPAESKPDTKPIDGTPSGPLGMAARIAARHNAAVARVTAGGPASGSLPGGLPPPVMLPDKPMVEPADPAPAASTATPAPAAAKPKPKAVPLPKSAHPVRVAPANAPTAALLPGNSAVDPFAALLTKAAELGTTNGKGRNTQIQFHLAVLDAAYSATVDLVNNKHGVERDDAALLTEAYVRAQNTATIFDAKAPNQRKAMSLVRTCIKLGHYRPTNGGSGEPVQTVNNLMTEWRKLRDDAKRNKNLQDATNALMSYARTQLKDPKLIPASRFRDFLYRSDREVPSAEEIVNRLRNALEALIAGKAAGGSAKDDFEEIKAAKEWLTVRLAKLAEERGTQVP